MKQIRTFIAIELDETISAALADLQAQLKAKIPQGSVRWVKPGGIHLTLKFLGDVPANRIEEIERALTQACAGVPSFSFSVGGLGCFPSPRRPRVLWVGVQEESGTLTRLQKAIEDRMEKLGFAPEGRKFHAHLTLGRAQRRASSGDVRRLGQLVSETEIGSLGQMEAWAVSLIKSDLKPTGAVYTQLAAMELEGT
ncbi:MAG: RNA 2',3'-cyclic phosphodiesterase [Anaerolineae bacterium]